MNILKFTLLSLVLLASPALRADPAPISTPVLPANPVVDPLAEALPILQAHYPDFSALDYKPGDKLGDLITRSKGEISLVTPDTLAPTPILTAGLPDSVVYWRLASFTPKKDWNELGTELQNDGQHGASTGAILDLRSNEAPEDMQGAARIVSFFAPRDGSLKRFNVKSVDGILVSNELVFAPHFSAPLIVLTDQRTSGAAEVLAACLKADGALVVGEQTSGRGAVFADWKLSSGQILRFVVDHVRLADGVDLCISPRSSAGRFSSACRSSTIPFSSAPSIASRPFASRKERCPARSTRPHPRRFPYPPPPLSSKKSSHGFGT
jgi:hypothetical protein